MSLVLKLFIIIAVIVFILVSCLHSGIIKQLSNAGVVDGHLSLCPESPNCVSTSCSRKDAKHYIEPIRYDSELNINQIRESIAKAISSIPGAMLVRSEDSINYMHFQFKTLLGFIDDVEILIEPEKKEIYFRSSSRLGYYDFGVNRKRYNIVKNKLSGALR